MLNNVKRGRSRGDLVSQMPQASGQIFHLITGGEGYGVATVLRQIRDRLPWVRYLALAPGKMTSELPPDRVRWTGRRKPSVRIEQSTILAVFSVLLDLGRWWSIAGDIARVIPPSPILFHTHEIFTAIIARFVQLRRPSFNIKVLFHFHSTMNPHRLLGILPVLQRFVVDCFVDGIVAVSNAAANYWRPIRCPIWVVHNGVEDREASSRPDYFVSRPGLHDIIIAGSLSREKGHLVAVEAMRILGPRVKDFHLWIAGGPLDESTNPFAGELRKKIKEYDIEQHVTLLGYLNHLRDLAPFAWIALQQRLTPEPCGLWILEAMSAGLPLIASDTGGTSELVRHEQEGLLVPPGNPQAVGDAILRLADGNLLRDRLAENALRRAKQFTIEKFTENICHVYSALGFL